MSLRPMCAPGVAKDLRMPLANGATAAGFRIIRQLGSGGMGEVYLAEHPRLPRHDALKILPPGMSADPEFRERFNRESDLTAALSHPHIVGVHDRGEFEGQLWISMDYVDGADAAHLLRESYPTGMPPDDVVEIVTAIAGALDYAHDRGLLHRDVKPGNILITQPAASGARRILLADFGVARRIDDVSGLTQTNMVVGTMSYTAPEQLMGRAIDGRADQYALAATAFHLLTGSPPFSDRNPAVVISQHLSGPPPRVGDARPELAPLDRPLSRALATDPAGRFPRCQDFAEALAACHNKPLSTPDAGPTVRAPSPAPAPTSPRDTGTAAPAARATPAPTSRRDTGVAAPALRRAPTAAAPQDSRGTAGTGAPPLATTCTRCPRHPGPVDRVLHLHDGAIAPSEPAGAARGHHTVLSDNDPAYVAVTRDDHSIANQLTIPDDHAANHFVISDDHLSSNISDDQTAHATIAPPATAGATSGPPLACPDRD
jgi:serine/threonine protein kinase